MERLDSRGIDEDGYILTPSNVEMQPQFQDLLRDVCTTLTQSSPLLDGIYIYGSVARGDAIPGGSDLDLTLVLQSAATSQDLEILESKKRRLESQHAEVIKIDFDIGSRSEVLAADNRLSWGYWLKHHCRCLWGNDLSNRFDRFKPSRDIAIAVNGDFETVLARYAEAIDQTTTPAQSLRLQREASRKLIRSTQLLCVEQDLMWPQTLEEHVELFVHHYPDKGMQVCFFLSEAKSPCAEPKAFACLLRDFLTWMVKETHRLALRDEAGHTPSELEQTQS
ncbi:nucleotidyltransferase domain-containing protein [Pseudomonas palleroniana]|uniref:nucleotidyltransferase domain-containing protein n=1 Tax=Pseudomonas palleroniana TaxID=191390 RepID=UPI001FCB58D8|nr:nucleotidyltransferase domain-containing protein [Pseudomonas palleroniana]UOK35956.1 nucleotidyltransferase domain-containing protein [Pseudomonas palleroniana]